MFGIDRNQVAALAAQQYRIDLEKLCCAVRGDGTG